MNPTPIPSDFQALFDARAAQMGFPVASAGLRPHHPVAGIHVRRGDKTAYLADNVSMFQALEKYLAYVEDFFRRCDLEK